MTDQGIKSRPRYERLQIDGSGRRHLLVSETGEVPHQALAEGVDASSFSETWLIVGDSRAIPSADGPAGEEKFRSRSHLLLALARRLAEEHMGFRLYVVGTEPFLWEIAGVAEAAGLGREEMRLFASGSAARRIFCNHCRTITPGVTTNIVQCSGCHAHLFVRDHFSRRLNAFAGVQIDAEVPGDIPATEELYS